LDTLVTSDPLPDSLLPRIDSMDTLMPVVAEVEVRELLPGEPFAMPGDDPTWLFLFVVGYAALAGFLRWNNASLFQYRLKAFLNYHLATQFFRDLDLQGSFLHIIYNLHMLMGFSLLGFLVIETWFPLPAYPDYVILGGVFGILAVLFIVRALLVRLVGAIFRISDTVVFAQFVSNIHYSTIAWVLMPIIVVAAFAGGETAYWALCISLAILVAGALIRYYRGFQVAREFIRSYNVPLALYICTVEIAPLLLAYQGTITAYRHIIG
jgi:hypothetical protein